MGGTKDARDLVSALRAAFPDTGILATAVSDYGAALLQSSGECTVLQGACNSDLLAALIAGRGVKVLVDATHPFAARASAEAEKAAAMAGIPCLRYSRPASGVETGEGVFFADDFVSAAIMAARLGSRLFLTIGTRHLGEFMAALPAGKEVVARVLPDAGSINRCRELGLSPASIVAVQGPVSRELNRAMFWQYGAEVVVAKESGEEGGTGGKAAAAKELGIPLVIIRRPAGKTGLTKSEIIRELEKII
jgi:precorrin-6A/cobalt-precorrin-6A reductase